MTAPEYSPAPWSYEYSPYRAVRARTASNPNCPPLKSSMPTATRSSTPTRIRPANFRRQTLAWRSAAPRLLASLVTCANLLADYDESDGPEGEAYREALAAVTEATGRPA